MVGLKCVHVSNIYADMESNKVAGDFIFTSPSFSKLAKLSSAKQSGGRLNKKDGLTRYGNSHVKDKTS